MQSFAGVGLGDLPADTLCGIVCKNSRKLRNWKQARVLVIDEISMLDGKLFDKLDAVGRAARALVPGTRHPEPFGGLQLIMCGDFFQLPPVGLESGRTIFCFEAKCWASVVPPHRQLVLRQVAR